MLIANFASRCCVRAHSVRTRREERGHVDWPVFVTDVGARPETVRAREIERKKGGSMVATLSVVSNFTFGARFGEHLAVVVSSVDTSCTYTIIIFIRLSLETAGCCAENGTVRHKHRPLTVVPLSVQSTLTPRFVDLHVSTLTQKSCGAPGERL